MKKIALALMLVILGAVGMAKAEGPCSLAQTNACNGLCANGGDSQCYNISSYFRCWNGTGNHIHCGYVYLVSCICATTAYTPVFLDPHGPSSIEEEAVAPMVTEGPVIDTPGN
jgi:hypothetical protein